MRRLILLTLMLFAFHGMAQKIDFNKGGRPESEGLEMPSSPTRTTMATSPRAP